MNWRGMTHESHAGSQDHPCHAPIFTLILKLHVSPPLPLLVLVLASVGAGPMVGASLSGTGPFLGVHNLDTGQDYASIQKAIDDPNTTAGHTIMVESGIYNERIVINKSLHIEGLDTGGGIPVINGGGRGDVVTLIADGIIVEGFNVTNAGIWEIGLGPAGIKVVSDNNTIMGNEVAGNDGGIYVQSSS